jgi:hypothetical protein
VIPVAAFEDFFILFCCMCKEAVWSEHAVYMQEDSWLILLRCLMYSDKVWSLHLDPCALTIIIFIYIWQAQSKVKQMMIFAYDHWGIIITDSSMWNKCDSSVLSWLDAKIAHKNAQKPTWLAQGWATCFALQCTPLPGEGCDVFW